MRYTTEIACTAYLTLYEQKRRIQSFLIDYFGTDRMFWIETSLSMIVTRDEVVYFTWLKEGKPDRAEQEMFVFEWREKRGESLRLKASFLNRLTEDTRQRQFDSIVADIQRHLAEPVTSLRITPKDEIVIVEQFHRRGDGKIGYGLYPYAEDEQGRWRAQLGTSLWIYEVDFDLLYEGIRQVYPLQLEEFDPTGLNIIGQSDWDAIRHHWAGLAHANPSSAEFLDYVSHWTAKTLSRVDRIAVQGNL